MTVMSLDELIRSDVLGEATPMDTITQIKAAAIREFEALDSRVKIHNTEYFNHSFAPDIVLSWPGSQISERYVYLRSTQHPGLLSEDVDRLGDQKPIVVGLVEIPRDEGPARSQLHENAQVRNTLVTDAPALASIEHAKQARAKSVASLLSSIIVRGGRGLVGDDEAREVTATVSAGLQAAETMGADSVLRATEALTNTLSYEFASSFSRVLQAVWIGSGGRSDLFPATQLSLGGGADDDTLEFLLDLDPIEDLQFWRRVGSGLGVEKLGRIRTDHPNPNLQLLVKANLDRLKARVFRIRDSQQLTFEDMDRPIFFWSISRGALTFRGPGWDAFIGEKSEDIEGIRGSITSGVSVADLRHRADDIALISLQLSDGHMAFDVNSLEQTDVVRSDQLQALEGSLGAGAKVFRARAINNSRQILCDFRRSTAAVPTSSIIGVADLLRTALRLLRPLEEGDLEALYEILSTDSVTEAESDASLFAGDTLEDDGD
jgi:hypothetical protein